MKLKIMKFLYFEVMLTQKKLKAVFFILVSVIQLQFTKQQLSFSLCEVLAGLSWHCMEDTHSLRLLWKSDLKTRGFMVWEVKPALQGQTKIRKEVLGLKTAVTCFSFPIHGYLGIFLQNSGSDQENHSYLELKRPLGTIYDNCCIYS